MRRLQLTKSSVAAAAVHQNNQVATVLISRMHNSLCGGGSAGFLPPKEQHEPEQPENTVPGNPPPAAMRPRRVINGTAKVISKEAQQNFLQAFRKKLKEAESKGDKKTSLEGFFDDGNEGDQPRSPVAAYFSAAKEALQIPEVWDAESGARNRLPSWLKLQIPKGPTARSKYNGIKKNLRERKLSTVCEEAKCPNIGECWGGEPDPVTGESGLATATIMIMGDTCTRGCRFCAIKTARKPPPLDPDEPELTAEAVAKMGVDYIVVTMVDRDDEVDGGAAHVAKTMAAIKRRGREEYDRLHREYNEARAAHNASEPFSKPAPPEHPLLLEVLAGDFRGEPEHCSLVASSGVDVYAHNIECVERVTPKVRDFRASYRQSLRMLKHVKDTCPGIITKTSIMLGVGETEEEVKQTLRDLREHGVDAVTLGQYLQPSASRMKVHRYVHPLEFDEWKRIAEEELGFLYCASGPMVRSSYRAGEFYLKNVINKRKEDRQAAAKTTVAAVM